MQISISLFSWFCLFVWYYHSFVLVFLLTGKQCWQSKSQAISKLIINHNFLKCNWCISCFIFTNYFVELWSDSVIGQLAVLRPVFGKLKQPIIQSHLS